MWRRRLARPLRTSEAAWAVAIGEAVNHSQDYCQVSDVLCNLSSQVSDIKSKIIGEALFNSSPASATSHRIKTANSIMLGHSPINRDDLVASG